MTPREDAIAALTERAKRAEAEVRILREALEKLVKHARDNRHDCSMLMSNPGQNSLARELQLMASAALAATAEPQCSTCGKGRDENDICSSSFHFVAATAEPAKRVQAAKHATKGQAMSLEGDEAIAEERDALKIEVAALRIDLDQAARVAESARSEEETWRRSYLAEHRKVTEIAQTNEVLRAELDAAKGNLALALEGHDRELAATEQLLAATQVELKQALMDFRATDMLLEVNQRGWDGCVVERDAAVSEAKALRKFVGLVVIRVEGGASVLDFGKGSQMANALSAVLLETTNAD